MDKITSPPAVVTLVTTVEHGEEISQDALTELLVKLLMAGVKGEGFWSGEILPPNRSETNTWTLLQRFRTEEMALAWKNSSARTMLLAGLKDIKDGQNARAADEVTTDAHIGSAVTAIVTDVKPSMEEEYWAWQHKIHSAQARFPGYGGIYIQPPPPGKVGRWTTLLRFDSPQALEGWLEAPERKDLLVEAEKFVAGTRIHKVTSSFPGFFPSDEEGHKPTPKWKGAAIVLIGLFPILEVMRVYYTPWASANHIRLVLALAGSTMVSVSLVSFVTMPLLVKLFSWWIAPEAGKNNLATNLKGLAIMVAVFLCEILAAWQILIQ